VNLPLVAQQAQAAGVIQLRLDCGAQRLHDFRAATAEPRVFFRHAVEHPFNVHDACLPRRIRCRGEQPARHRRIALIDRRFGSDLLLGRAAAAATPPPVKSMYQRR
jgi:hypothetical protein